MVPVSHTYLVIYHRVGGVYTSHLPSLASVNNSNIAADNMAYLSSQGITFNDENEPAPENIPDPFPHQLNPLNCKSERIILPR